MANLCFSSAPVFIVYMYLTLYGTRFALFNLLFQRYMQPTWDPQLSFAYWTSRVHITTFRLALHYAALDHACILE